MAAVAFTSRWWLPALPTFLGFVKDNSDLIGSIESLVSIMYILGILVSAALTYLEIRSLREPVAERESTSSVNVAEGSRGAVVSGNVSQGAVVAGRLHRLRHGIRLTRHEWQGGVISSA